MFSRPIAGSSAARTAERIKLVCGLELIDPSPDERPAAVAAGLFE
jgi:hypothetical protein